jgi:NADH dehydrogenase FAD-containing subunit
LHAELTALGVVVHLGAKAEGLNGVKAPTSGPLQIGEQASLAADLVFPAIGTKPNSALLRALAGASFDPLGRVTVDGWLRPAGAQNLFAFGDAAASGDLMTIVGVSRQAHWLAKAIKAILAGHPLETQPRYSPWRAPPILVPLGPKRGASVLPLTKSGLTVGGFLTSKIKGKVLFVPRYRKEFGIS